MDDRIRESFRNIFNKAPERVFFCPGRVNLIGEHIDYNGGHVMPCAIDRGTWLAVSRNTEKMFRFHSLDFREAADLKVQSSYSKTGSEWFNYPLGVINELFYQGLTLSGMDLLYHGNLPVGAGLSSSASIEVLTAFAAAQWFAPELGLQEIALLCKKAENEFIGVNSGIMDQFAVAKGRKDHALLLDCDSLEHEYLPFAPGNYALAVINSRKERKLSESKYNERFAECGKVLGLLKKEIDAVHLCDISPGQFQAHRHLVDDPVLQKRAMHVIEEQARVMRAAAALRKKDLEEFGRLMFDSHCSLRENYEVTGPELDAIVSFSQSFDGCIGARMTGAGFGGCAIAIVLNGKLDEFVSELTRTYKTEFGYEPEVFSVEATAGVRTIS